MRKCLASPWNIEIYAILCLPTPSSNDSYFSLLLCSKHLTLGACIFGLSCKFGSSRQQKLPPAVWEMRRKQAWNSCSLQFPGLLRPCGTLRCSAVLGKHFCKAPAFSELGAISARCPLSPRKGQCSSQALGLLLSTSEITWVEIVSCCDPEWTHRECAKRLHTWRP